MRTYKTKGIILKRQSFHEADRILTVLTDERGKIPMIAKGVRKPLSKLGSFFEPFYLVDLVVTEGKTWDIVTGAQVINYFPKFRQDIRVLGRVYRLGEIIDQLIEEREAQSDIFHLLKDTLELIDEDPQNQLVDVYFMINILSLIGYRPELYQCLKCFEQLKPERLSWSSAQGGVICHQCWPKADAYKISNEAVKVFRLLLKHNISIVKRLDLETRLTGELQTVLHEFVVYLNQKELVSTRFLEKIGR